MPKSLQPEQNIDPFARAIPGQSFAEVPGLRPYEKPALSADVESIIDALEKQLKEPQASKELADVLEVGVSVETICDIIAMKCFTEGMCTPDVAELIKPPLGLIITQIAEDHDIPDVLLTNELDEDQSLNDQQKLSMMAKLAPKKFQEVKEMLKQMEFEERATQDIEEDEYMPDVEMFFAGEEGPQDSEEMPAEQPSFLDMSTEEEEEEDNVIMEEPEEI